MKNENDLEVFGTLTKREPVLTIDDKIIPGTLVFEALAPFPGYYNDSPTETKPLYMYMALQQQYPLMDILRATEKVEKVFDSTFEAGKGYIQIFDVEYHVLRIRHLNQYNLIGKLQGAYMDQGIMPLRKTKKGLEEPAQIKLTKFFNLTKMDENIYLDNKEEYHAYLEIPHSYTWDEFTDLTNRVKYNWMESKFDAALGTFYHGGRLHEVVRIYTNQLSLPYLQELRKLYIEKLK